MTSRTLYGTTSGRFVAAPLVCAGALGVCMAIGAKPLPRQAPKAEIAPNQPNIRYIGRFDTRDPAGPRCAWSDSGVQVRFQGTALEATINEAGNDSFELVVDGDEPKVLALHQGQASYPLAAGLSVGVHTVAMFKRTEPFVGTTQFLGFGLNPGGKLLPVTPPKHRIEIVGDSITCGYGNEGKNQNEHFAPTTENAYQTYGAIAARALGADYTCVAWSGRKMSPDDTMPEIYDRALPADASSSWNFAHAPADVVLINLSTNDFGPGIPPRESWTKAYEAFVAHIRKIYPLAEVYCATSPMMSDTWPTDRKNVTTLKGYLTQIVDDEKKSGDTRVHVIEFETQDPKDGLGADWHPNVKTHEIMAEKLEATIEADLGWKVKRTTNP